MYGVFTVLERWAFLTFFDDHPQMAFVERNQEIQTVVLGNHILRSDRPGSTAFGLLEGEPLDFTRPASSVDNASFRDANRFTGADSVTVNRAAQGHRPVRMELRRRCLYAARRSYR